MKIGIITIQKSPASYGALLQAFALWKYIDDKGDCSAEIIDLYRPAQNGYIHSVKRVGFLNYNYRLNKRNRSYSPAAPDKCACFPYGTFPLKSCQ